LQRGGHTEPRAGPAFPESLMQPRLLCRIRRQWAGSPNVWGSPSGFLAFVTAMAFELAIVSVLAGIGLGLRYKVLILVPAVTLAMIFAMIVAIVRGDHFWSIILVIAIPGTAVQLGYLVGIAIRATVG
jgi:hypothetical protein